MALAHPHARRSLIAGLAGAALNYGLRQGASQLGNNIGRSLRHYYNRASMPTARTPRRSLKRKRPAGSHSGRRYKKPRRFTRRTLGRYRGRRYTQKRIGRYRALNTNVTRNDFRTLRVTAHSGSLEIGRDTALIQNNFRYICHLDHWTTQWSREIEAYDEFKITNVQFVLTPRSVYQATSNGAQNVVNLGEIPYMAVRVVNPNAPASVTLTSGEVRVTPGFRFLPFTSKKRFVVNVKPGLKLESSVLNEAGSPTEIERHISMPWMKIDAATKALDLAAIEIRKPLFESANGQIFKWDIRVYATLQLRGNKDELIEPY